MIMDKQGGLHIHLDIYIKLISDDGALSYYNYTTDNRFWNGMDFE